MWNCSSKKHYSVYDLVNKHKCRQIKENVRMLDTVHTRLPRFVWWWSLCVSMIQGTVPVLWSLAALTMSDWSKGRGQVKNSPWSSSLDSRPITHSRKKNHITETETRITTATYQEAGVQDANTQLEQHVKQRMTTKIVEKFCLHQILNFTIMHAWTLSEAIVKWTSKWSQVAASWIYADFCWVFCMQVYASCRKTHIFLGYGLSPVQPKYNHHTNKIVDIADIPCISLTNRLL